MIIRMGMIRKKENLSFDEFSRHWLEVHGPIASDIPGLRKYHQNHVIDSEQRGIEFPRTPFVLDGLSQLWFDDESSMQNKMSPDIIQRLSKDEANFISDLKLTIMKQNVVIPVSEDKPLIKRISIINRRPGIDDETFKHEWWNVHSNFVLEMPGIEGYKQNLVIERSVERGQSATYEQMPIDGIVELWFKDIPSLEAAFASPNGQKAMAHTKTFIHQISTFLVKQYELV